MPDDERAPSVGPQPDPRRPAVPDDEPTGVDPTDDGVRSDEPTGVDPTDDGVGSDGPTGDDSDAQADEPTDVEADTPADEPAPRPVIEARLLGLRLRSGWVFRHMDLHAAAGESVELVGSGATGRSMLLLALVGRARHTDGELDVLGTRLRSGWRGAVQARAVRRRTSVARIGPAIELDEQLTVGQSVADRRRWDGRRRGERPPTTFDDAAALVGLGVLASARVEHLTALERTLLAVALAMMAPHEVLVLDDADVGLSVEEHLRVGTALADVAATGVVVLSAAARPSGAERAVVVPMHAHQPVHAAQEVR